MTEHELVQKCIKDEAAAQKILFEQYAPMLLGVSYRYVKNETEAHEVLQLGFIKIFDKLHKFNFESALATWLTRIIINTALNYIKASEKIKLESDISIISEQSQFSVEQIHQIDLRKLMDCIQELPTGYRVVLNIYAIEGYSHKEIAEELKISESTSRSQFTRAKAMLEKKLIDMGYNLQSKYE